MRTRNMKTVQGTSAELAAANPVLRAGAMGIATDTGTQKIGDGVTAWDELVGTAAAAPKGTTLRNSRFFDGAPYTAFPDVADTVPTLTAGASPMAVQKLFNFTPNTLGVYKGIIKTPYAVIHGSTIYKTFGSGNLSTMCTLDANGVPCTVEWVTDAPAFDILGTFNMLDIALWVDGFEVYRSATSPFNTGQMHVDWAGVRKVRTYRLTTNTGIGLKGFACTVYDKIYAPDVTGRTAYAWLGDSWSQGTYGIPWRVGRQLGWDLECLSTIGGTGYISIGPSFANYQTRAAEVVAANPDVVVIAGGINDGTNGLSAAVTATLSTITSGLPGKPVFVIGPWCPPSATASSQQAKYDIITAAVAASPNTHFIDPRDVISGTGNTSNLEADGNADIYISSDNVHPNAAGRSYVADIIAKRIAAKLVY